MGGGGRVVEFIEKYVSWVHTGTSKNITLPGTGKDGHKMHKKKPIEEIITCQFSFGQKY